MTIHNFLLNLGLEADAEKEAAVVNKEVLEGEAELEN